MRRKIELKLLKDIFNLVGKGLDARSQSPDPKKITADNTPLIYAANMGLYNVVKSLIEKNVDVNETNEIEATALMWAARIGRNDIVKLLCDNGADVNAIDKYDNTAAVYAKYDGHMNTVALLEIYGADLDIPMGRDKSRLSIRDYPVPEERGYDFQQSPHWEEKILEKIKTHPSLPKPA